MSAQFDNTTWSDQKFKPKFPLDSRTDLSFVGYGLNLDYYARSIISNYVRTKLQLKFRCKANANVPAEIILNNEVEMVMRNIYSQPIIRVKHAYHFTGRYFNQRAGLKAWFERENALPSHSANLTHLLLTCYDADNQSFTLTAVANINSIDYIVILANTSGLKWHQIIKQTAIQNMAKINSFSLQYMVIHGV